MRLDHATWPEVDQYLKDRTGILLPTGSTEQHGPIGLIGTDTICATAVADGAGEISGAYVAPPLAYTPAPFNTSFPGTISVSEETFETLAREIFQGLAAQGFRHIYVLNGHGANLAPLNRAAQAVQGAAVRLRSWWDFAPVNELRKKWYGDWEGMHATPSEVAITRALVREAHHADAETPPRLLDAAYIAAHSGDRHGPPEDHRAAFPDGRVGSHSALARAEHGRALLDAATKAAAADFVAFCTG